MKTNIFTKKVSVFENCLDTLPIADVSLMQALTVTSVRTKVQEYRTTRDKSIKLQIPCYTPSGRFSSRRSDALIEHSGVLAIDIDGKDNADVTGFGQLKEIIQELRYVSYCGHSVGGEGYFLLIPIAYPDKHRQHFDALEEDFKRCGLTVDKACKDVARLRIMSYDDAPYINDAAEVYTRYKQQAPPPLRTYTGNEVERLISAIVSAGLDITGDYHQWLEIGAAIGSEFGEAGRAYFHQLSQFSPKYNRQQTDRKYTDFLRIGRFSASTLFHYANAYGLIIKDLRR